MRNRVYSDTGIDMDMARDFVYRISPEALKDPVGAVQQLLNSGEMSQTQLNGYMQVAKRLMDNEYEVRRRTSIVRQIQEKRISRKMRKDVNEYIATLSGDALRRAMNTFREIREENTINE